MSRLSGGGHSEPGTAQEAGETARAKVLGQRTPGVFESGDPVAAASEGPTGGDGVREVGSQFTSGLAGHGEDCGFHCV